MASQQVGKPASQGIQGMAKVSGLPPGRWLAGSLARRSGFTIIELLMTMGVASIIAATVSVGFLSLQRNAALRSGTDALVQQLGLAHSDAVNNVAGQAHGVYVESQKITRYAGANWVTKTATEQTVPLPNRVTVTAGLGDVAFTRLNGQTSAVTLTLSNGTSTRTVSVLATGAFTVQ